VFIHKSDYNSRESRRRQEGEGRQCLEFEIRFKGIIKVSATEQCQ